MYRTGWDYFWVWAGAIVLAYWITFGMIIGSVDRVSFLAALFIAVSWTDEMHKFIRKVRKPKLP